MPSSEYHTEPTVIPFNQSQENQARHVSAKQRFQKAELRAVNEIPNFKHTRCASNIAFSLKPSGVWTLAANGRLLYCYLLDYRKDGNGDTF